jgi:pyruvate dehydrogenase E1 component beta subunit
LAALLQHECFDYLDAPIERVATKDTPIPFSPPMEQFVVPGEAEIISAVRRTLGRE